MNATPRPVVLSGIQPSGRLTIGNYLGAIKNWLPLHQQYDCYYMLVDLHAITVRQETAQLRERCYEFLALYIACGLDPQHNVLFVQSHVAAHAKLAWVLNCGEDHALAATFPPRTALPPRWTVIGEVFAGLGEVLVDGQRWAGPAGWDHFGPVGR